MFLLGGAGAIAVGFLSGIGSDAWLWLKSGLDDSPNWSFWSEQTLSYIAVCIGIGSIVIGFLKFRKEKTAGKEKIHAEIKLNDLIKELQNFNRKWNRGILFMRRSYRTQILKKTIWNQNPEKIRTLSVKIKRKNAIFKELKIKNSSTIVNSITDISNGIAELGLEIEDVFLTPRQEAEAQIKDPNIFQNFVNTGDNICHEIISALKELEKLRTHVL